jgi:peptidyl-prolyl cis-trans isomerase B (cyclophilin B)
MAERVVVDTSSGQFEIEIDAARAPKSVDNFLSYVASGHYDGTLFHRVIAGFMIQGGGYDGAYERKPTAAPVVNEADNGLTNRRGTVAMARTADPHSATAQFFVNLVDNTPLDHTDKSPQGWGYTVFGEVVEGMEVVDAIAGVPTGLLGPHRDVPRQPVVIEKARVVEGEADGG